MRPDSTEDCITRRGASPVARSTSGILGGSEVQGRPQNTACRANGNDAPRTRLGGQRVANGSTEVLIQWEQPIGLQLAKNPSQLLLDPVNCVEECAAVEFQPPAAKLPIGA